MKAKRISYVGLLLCFALLINTHQFFGQEKFNVSIGTGFPELLNLGVRYQFNQSQLGLNLGTVPLGKNNAYYSLSSDYFYHFGGQSKLTHRRPWYARAGLSYIHSEGEYEILKILFFNPRIGRDFNISKKIGVNFDIGLIFELYRDEIEKKQHDSLLTFESPITFPSLGFGIFYRL
ncbi:MAG: hypothetical protein KDC91_02695 [Flavobacteriaceae bacterium]|nr:hypothetical protein [Flavobacteriaceae bacterium]